MTTPAEIRAYLHEHIPLSDDMGVTVLAVDADGVRLGAPLGPNINHRQTVFGGSVATLATLAAWALVHFRLREEEPETSFRVVIRRSSIDYPAPLLGDFEAFAPAPVVEEWSRFRTTLRRRSKARLTVAASVTSGGVVGATFEGEFVALATDAKVSSAA